MKGFVLKTTPIQERSLMAVVFFEELGKVSLFAKNCIQSRRYGTAFQLFHVSEFQLLQSRTQSEVLASEKADPIAHFDELSRSIIKLSAASYLNEIFLRAVPEHKKAPELFNLYVNTLSVLSSLPESQTVAILNAFLIKMLQWLGVQPSFTRCLNCSKTLQDFSQDTVFADVVRGGWTCGECNSGSSLGIPLQKNLLVDAYSALLNPIKKVTFTCDESLHRDLLQFLEQHFIYHVPGLDRDPLQASRVLKSALWPDQSWLDLGTSTKKNS